MTPFHYELEYSEIDEADALDSRGTKVTTIRCHGSILVENRGQVEEIFKGTPFHGRIVMDLGDVDYVDSAGLGALMRLKLSAVTHGGVSVKYLNMTPRVLQLLRLSNLTEWFTK
jgi:anti-anti-sigma factor